MIESVPPMVAPSCFFQLIAILTFYQPNVNVWPFAIHTIYLPFAQKWNGIKEICYKYKCLIVLHYRIGGIRNVQNMGVL